MSSCGGSGRGTPPGPATWGGVARDCSRWHDERWRAPGLPVRADLPEIPHRPGADDAVIEQHAKAEVALVPLQVVDYLAHDVIHRVVLLGPAHHVAFDGLALPSQDALATPLGR